MGETAKETGKGRLQGYVIPHSATIIEDAAHKRHSPAVDALKNLHKKIAQEKIDAIISISPFWVPEHSFYVDSGPRHKARADYQGYTVDIQYHGHGDPDLAHAMIEEGKRAGLPVKSRHHGADHSSTVALHLLDPEGRIPLIPLSSTELSLEKCVLWGECIRKVVEASGKNVVIFSGGGLSHNLTACIHWDDSIAAVIFDQKVLRCLEEGRGPDVVKMDPYWIEVGNPTAEFRDLFIFLGAIGRSARGHLMAYEGAPGVGWAVMKFS